MSAKSKRRHARKAKTARHQARRAAQRSEPVPAVPAAPAFDREALRRDYVPSAARALPVACLAPAVDARGDYVPLADDVRAGIIDAVAEGMLPDDAALLFGVHAPDFAAHLEGDLGLAFDLERAGLAAKLRHLKIINEAPSSERIRAARWFLKVRFPEEFDAVIVSRRARAALDAVQQAQQARRNAARRAQADAAARHIAAQMAGDPVETRAPRDPHPSADPVHLDGNPPPAPADEAPAEARSADESPDRHAHRAHLPCVTAA